MRTNDGRMIFGVFAPLDIPDVQIFVDTWNKLAVKHNLKGFYFFALCQYEDWMARLKALPYDAIVFDTMPLLYWKHHQTLCGRIMSHLAKMKIATYHIDYTFYTNESIKFLKNMMIIHHVSFLISIIHLEVVAPVSSCTEARLKSLPHLLKTWHNM